MRDESGPDLSMLMQLVRQMLAEQGVMRDDMRVLTAIAMRQDNTLAALLTEIRAMHAQPSRVGSRVRALEPHV